MPNNRICKTEDSPRLLDLLLSIEHRQHGLTLIDDEAFIYMINQGQIVASWRNDNFLTVKEIHDEADKWLPRDAVEDMLRLGKVIIIPPGGLAEAAILSGAPVKFVYVGAN